MPNNSNILPDNYFTLAATAVVETKIQRSRFIAIAGPANDEISAREFINETARQYHDSRHVCHGWRMGLGTEAWENRNDDGEPSGTAGEPILAAIRRSELTDLVVVVVRYFGGIKLGTGGLSRAYGGTADQVLEIAPRREVLLGLEFTLEFPYAQQKTIQHLLGQNRGRTTGEIYGAEVEWKIWLPHSTCQSFLAALKEATAGILCPVPISED